MKKSKNLFGRATGFITASPWVGGGGFAWADKQNEKSDTKPEFLTPRKSRQELTGNTDKDRKAMLAKYGLFAAPNSLAFEVESDKKREKLKDAGEIADRQKAESAAAAAAAEEPFTKAKESQVQALKRKGRRASILTSSQGASDPLGIPG